MTVIHPVQQIDFTRKSNACVIEASAGTGKTWTIERLYIKALLEATSPLDTDIVLNVENILVVTFTNDATDELKERLYTQIEKTINLIIYLHNHAHYNPAALDMFSNYLLTRQNNYKKDVMHLTRALQNFDQAAIFTIHGFCNKILHDYQFECKVNPEAQLIKDKTEIFKQIVFNFLRSKILTAPQFARHINTVMANLNDFFAGTYDVPLVDRIVSKLPKDLFKIQQGKYVIKYQFIVPENINFLSAEIIEDRPRYKAEFLAYLINYIYQYYHLQPMVDISYDELIQTIADSLKNSRMLADNIFHKFPIAFIDEFQDTDLLQWQIFSNIYHLSHEGDLKCQPRGNVIVVGDPKQAIYRFRGADVDTYIEAKNQISQHLNLVHNYRSQADIMNFINQLFDLSNQKSNINSGYLGDGIGYWPIIASVQASRHNYLPSKNELEQIFAKNSITENIYNEPVQIVSIRGATKRSRTNKLLQTMTFEILALLNANPELKGKIAVLVTKNREAVELVKYFANFGIKAAELKLGNIFATGTATELYCILNALADPAQRNNFILAITTKIFNISLAGLANKENNPLLELFHQRFFRYKQIWESFGIFSLLYAILEDVTLDKNNLTNRELANLWQLAELLNKYHQKINNQIELLFWFKDRINKSLDNQVDNSEADSEELIRLENDDEQIIITTQHKAKGLEYEILFCPYFKSSILLDGQSDFNYRRPFFSNYRIHGKPCSELVLDQELARYIVEKDNKEIHRLNYVALTRARNRIYIYLKQNTITKASGKYNAREKPDKLAELFGYVKSDPNDRSHPLFNYPEFFGRAPQLAIKDPIKFPGVSVYNRDNLTDDVLYKLKLNMNAKTNTLVNVAVVKSEFTIQSAYVRQSYSGLTKVDVFDKNYDYYEKTEDNEPVPVSYRYKVLNDKKLSGALFGTLFHELCEIYPFTDSQLEKILTKYNVINNEYKLELTAMIAQAFTYPLLAGKSLSDFSNIIYEMEFNLTVGKTLQIQELINKSFGRQHPFSVACQLLGGIKAGFLIGFMDVCFEHEGKYWVLDYKTNTLAGYTGAAGIDDINNLITQSMAEHHYYLQYLLYLVALKRYLQVRLKVDDATDLIGGAIYYYVRGIYLPEPQVGDGLFIDSRCQKLVHELDKLLKR